MESWTCVQLKYELATVGHKNPPNIVCVAKQGTLWHQNGPRKMEPYILPHTFQNLAQYDEKEININMYIWHMDMSLIYSP